MSCHIIKEIETTHSIIVGEKLTLSIASLTTLLCLLIIVSLISSISSCGNPIGTFVAANFGFGRVIHINSDLSRFFKMCRFFGFFQMLFNALKPFLSCLWNFGLWRYFSASLLFSICFFFLSRRFVLAECRSIEAIEKAQQ